MEDGVKRNIKKSKVWSHKEPLNCVPDIVPCVPMSDTTAVIKSSAHNLQHDCTLLWCEQTSIPSETTLCSVPSSFRPGLRVWWIVSNFVLFSVYNKRIQWLQRLEPHCVLTFLTAFYSKILYLHPDCLFASAAAAEETAPFRSRLDWLQMASLWAMDAAATSFRGLMASFYSCSAYGGQLSHKFLWLKSRGQLSD